MRAPATVTTAVTAAVSTAVAADVGCVLLFVVIGRANHHHGETLAGVASTAWPFLVGLAAGWVVARAWRRPAGLLPGGVAAWLACAAGGQLLRVIAGQGSKPAFVAVSVVFLGLFLLGWRAAARKVARRTRAALVGKTPPASPANKPG